MEDTLVKVSAVLLIIAIYIHWDKFGNSEYNRSTWQNNTKMYGRWLIFAVVLFAMYVLFAMNQGYPVPKLSVSIR